MGNLKTVPDCFRPIVRSRALASSVLVVATTRTEGTWKAYVRGVPGYDHREEIQGVLDWGDDIGETIARILFPEFKDLPYAK